MKRFITQFVFSIAIVFVVSLSAHTKENQNPKQNPPIYIAFLWHMHQPIYWPYETINQTQANNRYSFSVVDIHNQRLGPYNAWPKIAVEKLINAGLPNAGAQVSFSGSLVENLNNLQAAGNGNFSNWKSHWNAVTTRQTALGNPRLDMVGFGFYHPLMGLVDQLDIRKQIQAHKTIMSQNFSGSYSKGIFPPENAFSNRMIVPLVQEGLQWVLVDNIHFDRAATGYPFSTGGNIYEPNKADILNANPNDWVQLNGLWAPTKNSAKWGRQPHYVEHVNPNTGEKTKIIAVPADRYMGNEDGRGGFGALNYEAVMSQLESYNTDPNHPILIVLHHDGDNYGGGSEGYYNGNFQGFVNWVQANPNRFKCTTIQDYLQMFPPDPNDIIHIEDGSWSGADNGDPEFKKWLGDPGSNGYSPDRNSWGVLTAVKNHIYHAEANDPNNANTKEAWRYFMVAQSSDYWYWDGAENGIWDSHPTRGANQAYQLANLVGGTDITAPTIFLPQREPYNPGGTEWGINQPNNFTVWSYVYDKAGLSSVKLKYRLDVDGSNSLTSVHNETYAGGTEVGEWVSLDMTGVDKPATTNPAPLVKAKEYSAMINGLNNKLVDYYIEAVDANNNVARSPIMHVWVGANTGGGGGGGGQQQVLWSPTSVSKNDTIMVTIKNAPGPGKLHWGVNNSGSTWQTPDSIYWPIGTVKFNGTGPAVESAFSAPDTANTMIIKIGPFNSSRQNVDRVNFVIHYDNNTWNNNNGQDFLITLGSGGGGGQTFVMDGQVDANSRSVATNSGANLYVGWNGTELYVATQAAPGLGKDAFLFISDSLRGLVNAPWAKAGKVAQWGAFLANESTNNYSAWFDATGATGKSAGQVLEGTINLRNEFGFIPARVYIAVGHYGTNDAGTLQSQVPVGNSNGDIEATEFFAFDYSLVSSAQELFGLPSGYRLEQNYPNPFNPSTNIRFSVAQRSLVTLTVVNALGQIVATPVKEERGPGIYSVNWDATGMPSGVYFYHLNASGVTLSKKMLLMK